MRRDHMIKKSSNNNTYVQIYIGLLVMVISLIISISIGRYPISIKEIAKIVLGKEVSELTQRVFLTLRLPRTLMALLAGAGLSISGSVYQTIFKNPLATPDIIGISSGANLGAAVAIGLLSGRPITVAILAFIGGLLAVFGALGLTRITKNIGVTTFILAGIVIGSISQGLIMLIKFTADPERQLASIEYWSMGSLASVTDSKLLSILPFFLLGIMGLYLLRWKINILSLSDQEGNSLGIRVNRIRISVIISATLVVASVVSVTGLISFIGLIGPHIARIITKKNDFNTAILGGISGAIIIIIADTLARSLSSSEIPISILTTFIGAPFLAYLMRKIR